MNVQQAFSIIILGIFSFWQANGSAYAGNEREEILNSFLKSNHVVSAHVKRTKGRKKTLGLAKNSSKTNGMLHNSSNSSQSRSAVSMGGGQFKFESKNEIRHDIFVQGDSEFNIGGISLGGSTNKGTGSNSSKSRLIGTGGFIFDNTDGGGNRQQVEDGVNDETSENEELAQLEKALEMMILADNAYENPLRSPSDVWKKIDSTAALKELGLSPEDFKDDLSGFSATLFKNNETGEYVLSFRGTELSPSELIKDGGTDIKAKVGIENMQYTYAARLATLLNVAITKEEGCSLSFTGHSLGGGLASLASLVTGREAVVFNPATINPASYVDATNDSFEKVKDQRQKDFSEKYTDTVTKGTNIVGQLAGGKGKLIGKTVSIAGWTVHGWARTYEANKYVGDTMDRQLKEKVTVYSVEGDPVSDGIAAWTGGKGKVYKLPKQAIYIGNHDRAAIYRALQDKKDEVNAKQATL